MRFVFLAQESNSEKYLFDVDFKWNEKRLCEVRIKLKLKIID